MVKMKTMSNETERREQYSRRKIVLAWGSEEFSGGHWKECMRNEQDDSCIFRVSAKVCIVYNICMGYTKEKNWWADVGLSRSRDPYRWHLSWVKIRKTGTRIIKTLKTTYNDDTIGKIFNFVSEIILEVVHLSEMTCNSGRKFYFNIQGWKV